MRYEITHPNIENIENGVHTASALVLKVIIKVKFSWAYRSHSNFEAPLNGWSFWEEHVIFRTSLDNRRVSLLRSSICCTSHSSCYRFYFRRLLHLESSILQKIKKFSNCFLIGTKALPDSSYSQKQWEPDNKIMF